jgi:hypothetical protein
MKYPSPLGAVYAKRQSASGAGLLGVIERPPTPLPEALRL